MKEHDVQEGSTYSVASSHLASKFSLNNPFITIIKHNTTLIAFGSKKEPIKYTFPTGPRILNC